MTSLLSDDGMKHINNITDNPEMDPTVTLLAAGFLMGRGMTEEEMLEFLRYTSVLYANGIDMRNRT